MTDGLRVKLNQSIEKWNDLLKNLDKNIVLSISAYEYREWYPEVCSMARTTYDIAGKIHGGAVFHSDDPKKNFMSVMTIAEQNNKYAKFAGKGYWNDPDMMVIGDQGLSLDEQKSHFALWCIMSSPLMLGNDPRNMNKDELDIIVNKSAIRVNQDTNEQGRRIYQNGKTEIWRKFLSDGNAAILFLNKSKSNEAIMSLKLTEIGFLDRVKVFDIFNKNELEFDGEISLVVKPNSSYFFLLSE